MKSLLKTLAIISLISLFFSGFIFFIGPIMFSPFKIIVPLTLLIYVLVNKNILKKILILYKRTPFKYLVWFIIWLFIDAFILVILGRAKILIFYSIAWKLIPVLLEVFFLTALFIPKIISIKNFIKILTIINYSIFVFALIEYLGSIFSISLISQIVDSISNLKQVMFAQGEMIDFISGGHRVRSIFHEPGSLAAYIFFIMPIFYSLILSKNRIFKNNITNKIIKLTFIPLMWITLILTKSPIFLVFSLISSAFYFAKYIMKFIKANILIFTIIFAVVLCIFNPFVINLMLQSFEGTYITRITNVITSIKNINDVIENEPSLGFRIVSFINALRAYIKYPILGYGYDNLRYYIEPYLLSSPVVLTRENILAMTLYYKPGTGVGINYTNITRLLTETGIVGTILFYFYTIKNLLFINKIKKYYSEIVYDFCCGLQFFVYCSIFASVYVHILGHLYVMLLYGVICATGMSLYRVKLFVGEKHGTTSINSNDNI